ncbi:hypothetical protein BDQ12DRAFT_694405 [Crucibulum laeve]|uniref:Uncharacterized protein n=1 Tax=Crucibulum laeve TaxID=68775 RepID=A0A5C3LEF7_9AGAR|nr:hypothetical protein BDQ12DRAFT_694405 [Crucibulum laeve]
MTHPSTPPRTRPARRAASVSAAYRSPTQHDQQHTVYRAPHGSAYRGSYTTYPLPSSASSTSPSSSNTNNTNMTTRNALYAPPLPQPALNTPTSSPMNEAENESPRFSRLLTTVLGSPFLTTADAFSSPLPLSSVDLEPLSLYDQQGQSQSQPQSPNYYQSEKYHPHTPTHIPRSSSPAPTADYSIIDVDPEYEEGAFIPGGYHPYAYSLPHLQHRSDSRPHLQSHSYSHSYVLPNSYPNSHTHSRSLSMSMSANLGFVRSRSYTNPNANLNMSWSGPVSPYHHQHSPFHSTHNPLKTLLPRLWDALSSPGRTLGLAPSSSSPYSSSSNSSSSDITPSSSPRPAAVGRKSPLPWGSSRGSPSSQRSPQSNSSQHTPPRTAPKRSPQSASRRSPLPWSKAKGKGNRLFRPASNASLGTNNTGELVDYSELFESSPSQDLSPDHSYSHLSSQMDYSHDFSAGDYSDSTSLAPLDGEEGELIDDEACCILQVTGRVVDVRAVTGIDILALLPPELALHILMFLCPPPLLASSPQEYTSIYSSPPPPSRMSSSTSNSQRYSSHSSRSYTPSYNQGYTEAITGPTAEYTPLEALHTLLSARAVSRTWCRLASDNAVWRGMFLGRWGVELGRGVGGALSGGGGLDLKTAAREREQKHTYPPLPVTPRRRSSRTVASPSSPLARSRRTTTHRYTYRDSVISTTPLALPHGPLQLDWCVMYKQRWELEMRWSGRALRIREVNDNEGGGGGGKGRNGGYGYGYDDAIGVGYVPPTPGLGGGRQYPPASPSSVRAIRHGVDGQGSAGVGGVGQGRGMFGFVTGAGMSSSVEYERKRDGMVGFGREDRQKTREERWEPESMKISGHNDSVYCLEFDTKRIITGSRDRSIKVWSLHTGALLATFWGAHRGSVLCLKFEKDWEEAGGDVQEPYAAEDKFDGNDKSTAGDGHKPRRGFMVSGSSDCSICVWDMDTGAPVSGLGVAEVEGYHGDLEADLKQDREVTAEVRAVLKGHTGGVLDLRMDRKWIVSCSKDASIRVWDRSTLELHRTLRGHEGPVNAVGMQSGRVVSASGDGKMILWDVQSGERLRTFEGHDRGLACIEFKDDLIVSGSNDCMIKLWSATTGECLRTLVGHDALVRALSFDPRSGRLVSASYDKTVKVWDLGSGKMVREFKGTHTSHIFDVKFDVARIVSTSHDQKIVVLDFSKGLEAAKLFV